MADIARSALAGLLGFQGELQVADIGAAHLGSAPPYQPLLDLGLARLHAFEADERQHQLLRAAHGDRLTLHGDAIADGAVHTLHLATPESGMSSLLRPSATHLAFFNGFERFGEIHEVRRTQTRRLDDIAGLPGLDYLKMDIQGAEMMALRGGEARLAASVAIQLEVSFIPLYEGQPSFGEIDLWMRARGFVPHAFAELKRWSIAPILRNNDIRQPFNQLLEADVVYVRDPVTPGALSPEQARRLALVAHHVYRSVDLAGRLVSGLAQSGEAPADALNRYLEVLRSPSP